MTFNQVIWDALCFAVQKKYPKGLEALIAYAAEHDGKVKGSWENLKPGAKQVFEFIPNPIPKY